MSADARVPRLQSLQMLRGVAALLVVLFHVDLIFGLRAGANVFGHAFAAANHGVDLFFVLSGFVIAHVHWQDLGRPERLWPYLLGRISRVYPSAAIVTASALAMYAAGGLLGIRFGFGGGVQAGRLQAWNIAASVLLLPQNAEPVVNVTWTLKYEVAFYAAFGLVILDRRLWHAFVAWQAIVLACLIFGIDFGTAWPHYWFGGLNLEFGIGIAAAVLVMERHRFGLFSDCRWQATGLAAGIALFVGTAVVETYWRRFAPAFALACYAIAGFLIVTGLAWLDLAGRLPASRWLAVLGEASYSIYLINFPLINLASAALWHGGLLPLNNAVYLGFAGLAMVAGFAFHHVIDRPLQAATRRMRLREQSSAVATVRVAQP